MAEYLIQDTTLANIAEAIKSKTGDNTEIAVSDMATKIGSIIAGNLQCKLVTGSFLATSKQQTVSHKIKEVPDIFIILLDDVPSAGTTFSALGFSNAMIEALGGGYISTAIIIASGGGTMNATSNVGIEEDCSGYYVDYGGVRNFTNESFVVGGSTIGLKIGAYYSYYAICGLC